MVFLWSRIQARPLPDGALLTSYADTEDCYTDCYTTHLLARVALPDFVAAFYTTRLFKLERVILKAAASRPSTDEQARELGLGLTDQFAAWRVEKRTGRQLLMCDFSGRTRSWLMVDPVDENTEFETRLYFGSAVVPGKNRSARRRTSRYLVSGLLAFHRLYSRALLSAAQSRLDLELLG